MLDIKKTEHLFHNSYISYVATAFGALLVVWLLHRVAPQKILLSWFLLFLLLTMARSVLTYCFQKKRHTLENDTWLILFLIGAFASGIFWGITGFLLIPDNGMSLLDSVVYHGMLLLFIAVLIAASVITYSISRSAYFCFAIPAVVPQCLMLIHKGDNYHSFLGGFMLAYALVVFVISLYVNRMLLVALATQEENEKLRRVLKDNKVDVNQLKDDFPVIPGSD
ncbi:MAG: hypothetical protein RIB78_09035 [Gammaproteobacteria bacterium]